MSRSPNDDRSDRYNPTSGSYWAAEANEARQRGDDGYQDEEGPPNTAPPFCGWDEHHRRRWRAAGISEEMIRKCMM